MFSSAMALVVLTSFPSALPATFAVNDDRSLLHELKVVEGTEEFPAGSIKALEDSGVVSNPTTSDCRPDLDLAGDWSSYRMSERGPSWVALRFGCDCTYRRLHKVDLKRSHSSGSYRTQDDRLVLRSQAGLGDRVEAGAYRLDKRSLFLTERDGDEYRYRRTESARCGI